MYSEWTSTERLDIQRWENEGGQMAEPDDPAATHVPARNSGIRLQWNNRWVIEPLTRAIGILRDEEAT